MVSLLHHAACGPDGPLGKKDTDTKRPKFTLAVQYNSPVILTFFLLSLGALFLGRYTGGWTTTHLFSVYRSSLKDPLFYFRLLGHVLGHGSWDHFINNMLLLLVVGPPMEEKYGSLPLLKGILLTALYCHEPFRQNYRRTSVPPHGPAGGVGHRLYAHHAGVPVRFFRRHPGDHAAGGGALSGPAGV